MIVNLLKIKLDSMSERGYTLLEYSVGAAVLMTIVMVGLNAFGIGLQAFFNNLGTWVQTVTPVVLNT